MYRSGVGDVVARCVRRSVSGMDVGLRVHHLDPPELRWLMLRANEMAQFLVLLAAFTAMWALPLAWAFGGGLLGP